MAKQTVRRRQQRRRRRRISPLLKSISRVGREPLFVVVVVFRLICVLTVMVIFPKGVTSTNFLTDGVGGNNDDVDGTTQQQQRQQDGNDGSTSFRQDCETWFGITTRDDCIAACGVSLKEFSIYTIDWIVEKKENEGKEESSPSSLSSPSLAIQHQQLNTTIATKIAQTDGLRKIYAGFVCRCPDVNPSIDCVYTYNFPSCSEVGIRDCTPLNDEEDVSNTNRPPPAPVSITQSPAVTIPLNPTSSILEDISDPPSASPSSVLSSIPNNNTTDTSDISSSNPPPLSPPNGTINSTNNDTFHNFTLGQRNLFSAGRNHHHHNRNHNHNHNTNRSRTTQSQQRTLQQSGNINNITVPSDSNSSNSSSSNAVTDDPVPNDGNATTTTTSAGITNGTNSTTTTTMNDNTNTTTNNNDTTANIVTSSSSCGVYCERIGMKVGAQSLSSATSKKTTTASNTGVASRTICAQNDGTNNGIVNDGIEEWIACACQVRADLANDGSNIVYVTEGFYVCGDPGFNTTGIVIGGTSSGCVNTHKLGVVTNSIVGLTNGLSTMIAAMFVSMIVIQSVVMVTIL